MITARQGFNAGACAALYEAFHDAPHEAIQESVEAFLARVERDFVVHGLYDPDPVGAFIFKGPHIHVGLVRHARGKARPAIAECVEWGLKRYPMLIAKIHPDNHACIRLAQVMEFKPWYCGEAGFMVYTRRNQVKIHHDSGVSYG